MQLISIPANPVPEGGTVGTLKTTDGVMLRFARWEPPPGRRGTLCIFAGRAEFIEKYFETVRELRARGFAVATIDWRGQGGTERALADPRKGHVGSVVVTGEGNSKPVGIVTDRDIVLEVVAQGLEDEPLPEESLPVVET